MDLEQFHRRYHGMVEDPALDQASDWWRKENAMSVQKLRLDGLWKPDSERLIRLQYDCQVLSVHSQPVDAYLVFLLEGPPFDIPEGMRHRLLLESRLPQRPCNVLFDLHTPNFGEVYSIQNISRNWGIQSSAAGEELARMYHTLGGY